MTRITLHEAAQMLRAYGYEISGGHFDTVEALAAYYRQFDPVRAEFIAADIRALLGDIEPDDPRELAAALDTLTA